MNHQPFLKVRSYYEDRYDHMVVEQCRASEKIVMEGKTGAKLSDAQKQYYIRLMHYFETGELYAKRKQTIAEWMDKDRWRDDKYEKTPVPDTFCRLCHGAMELAYQSLEFTHDFKSEHVVFYFGCYACKLTVTITENGKREERIPWQCPNCKKTLEEKVVKTRSFITTHSNCASCGYTKSDRLDLRRKKVKLPTPEELQRFKEDRARFCLSPQEGMDYVHQRDQIHQLNELMKEKRKPPVNNLTFAQVEQTLRPILEEHGYARLTFDKPDLKDGIVMGFTIQDTQNRDAYQSRKTLKKLIIKALVKSNWRLLTDTVDYRLGILSGRLKGEEHPDGCYIETKGKVEFVKF